MVHLQLGIIQRKTFEGDSFGEFQGFVAIRKVFSAKFEGMRDICWWHKQAPRKVFSMKFVFFTNLQKFSLLRVFRYTVHCADIVSSSLLLLVYISMFVHVWAHLSFLLSSILSSCRCRMTRGQTKVTNELSWHVNTSWTFSQYINRNCNCLGVCLHIVQSDIHKARGKIHLPNKAITQFTQLLLSSSRTLVHKSKRFSLCAWLKEHSMSLFRPTKWQVLSSPSSKDI